MQQIEQHLAKGAKLVEQGKLQEAQHLCQQLLKAAPNYARTYTLAAMISQRANNMEQTIACLEKALELEPEDISVLENLSKLYKINKQHAKALECLYQLEKITPNNPDVYVRLGSITAMSGDMETSNNYYEKAITLDPERYDLYGIIAYNHLYNNDKEKSRETVERVRNINQNYVNTMLIAAELAYKDGNLEHAREICQHIIDDPSSSAVKLTKTYNILAQSYEKSGDYDKAYDYFCKSQDTAKKDFERLYSYRAHEDTLFNNMIQGNIKWVKEQDFTSWEPESKPDTSSYPVFVVGAPRSGTTLMEQILSCHHNLATLSESNLIANMIHQLGPLLQTTKIKFPEMLHDLKPEHCEALRSRYYQDAIALLGDSYNGQHIIDKHPQNLPQLLVISRIFPHAKVMMMIRDPRDVCLSCFVQTFGYNMSIQHYFSLESAVEIYANTMELYFEYRDKLPLDILEIKYEDLVSDIDHYCHKIVDFIGEEWDENILHYYEKHNRNTYNTPSFEAVTRPVYTSSIGKWKNYAKQFEPYRKQLEPYVKAFGYEE